MRGGHARNPFVGVGELLKILHLIAAEKINLSPSFVVELQPLTGHQLAFLWRA